MILIHFFPLLPKGLNGEEAIPYESNYAGHTVVYLQCWHSAFHSPIQGRGVRLGGCGMMYASLTSKLQYGQHSSIQCRYFWQEIMVVVATGAIMYRSMLLGWQIICKKCNKEYSLTSN